MASNKRPDLSDLWESMARESRTSESIRTFCYVAQASGPVLTVITNQPVNVAELLADITQRAEARS